MKRKRRKPRYYIETLDMEKESFTPQQGVRKGPYSLFGLRKEIKKLRGMGYPCTHRGCFDRSVLIYRKGA